MKVEKDQAILESPIGPIKKMVIFLRCYGKKIGAIAIGHTIKTTVDWLFDNPLYIFVVAKEGMLFGGLIMTIASLVINFLLIIFHGWSKVDWFGFSVINDLRENGHHWLEKAKNIGIKNKILKPIVRAWLYIPVNFFALVIWLLKRGDVVAFITLSIVEDPFITTTYLRHGSRAKLTKKDWSIFFGSVVFSNAYWTLRSFAIFEVLKMLWDIISSMSVPGAIIYLEYAVLRAFS
jgi:hypothetical protein